MDKLFREYSTDIIRGVRPISDFDEFVTKWNAAGGTRISDYLATVLK
jgi:putative aldouronate transport system substrate-binding protein